LAKYIIIFSLQKWLIGIQKSNIRKSLDNTFHLNERTIQVETRETETVHKSANRRELEKAFYMSFSTVLTYYKNKKGLRDLFTHSRSVFDV
jgi:hypothetical protein